MSHIHPYKPLKCACCCVSYNLQWGWLLIIFCLKETSQSDLELNPGVNKEKVKVCFFTKTMPPCLSKDAIPCQDKKGAWKKNPRAHGAEINGTIKDHPLSPSY